MSYSEDALLPISALQHLLFCQRQCALIHVERLWAENRFTVEGQHLHQKAHHGQPESHGNVQIVRGMWIRSLRLGLVGQADVVEFEHQLAGPAQASGPVDTSPPDLPPRVTPPPESFASTNPPAAPVAGFSTSTFSRVTPIEYKRGRPKKDNSDRVQLCAQALCLEEMLGRAIPCGFLFYGKRQRRVEVSFDETLRAATEAATLRLHEMIRARETPPAVYMKKCETCSLLNLCLPAVAQRSRSAVRFVGRQFAAHLRDGVPRTDLFDTESTSP